jgi:nitroreductase
MLYDLVLKNRSCRRYDQSKKVSAGQLTALVELARLTASAGNRQPLKYVLSANPEENQKINGCLTWAAYFQGWVSPPEGERPGGFIIILRDTELSGGAANDVGIAAQTMMLGAAEMGMAGCMLGAVDRKKLSEVLHLDARYAIELVLAIGYPKETIILEHVAGDGDIKYYRDSEGAHHVPKRALSDLIVMIKE